LEDQYLPKERFEKELVELVAYWFSFVCLIKNGMRSIAYFCIFSFLWVGCEKSSTNEIKVGIQPYADFSKAKADTVAKIIHTFYGVETIILPTKSHDISTFTKVKAPRYRADKIIKLQK
jgi:hypothetical protein